MTAAGRKGFVTGGTWCADHNKLIEFWPQEDSLSEILSEDARGGGSGCNFAIDIRKLDPDMPVETIGLIGDDDDGRLLQSEADAHGIDRRQLHVTRAARTSYTDAYGSKASGRRTHIFTSGAGALLSPDHFDFDKTSAAVLHLGLPGVHATMDSPWGDDANGWVTVLRKARAAGLKTNLELVSIAASRMAGLVRPCLPHLDLAVVNDLEIGALAGEVRVAFDTAKANAEAVGMRHLPEAAVPDAQRALKAARLATSTKSPAERGTALRQVAAILSDLALYYLPSPKEAAQMVEGRRILALPGRLSTEEQQ